MITGKTRNQSSGTYQYLCMPQPAILRVYIQRDQFVGFSFVARKRNGMLQRPSKFRHVDIGGTRLRWTATQEWHDIYQEENIDDLQRFLDKYMYELDNGWEKTPKVRQSMLGYNRPSVINRPASEYPPVDFHYHTFFLDAKTRTLSKSKPNASSSAEYHAESQTDDGLSFSYKFDRYTELCGISKATLYMSTDDHNDMVSSRTPNQFFTLILAGCIHRHTQTGS